jgi:C4-dicarboxylate-specific signal transduction histidine kinase
MRPFRDFEFEVLDLSGSVHYFQVSGSPTYDKNGHFLGYLGVGQNINLRKQRELELTQLMLAINNLSESIVLFDTTDRIVFSNTAFRAMNKSIAEFTTQGTLFEDYLRANVRAELVLAGDAKEDEWIAERIAQHHKPQGPIEIFRQDGKTVLVNEQVFPDIGTILIISDITANKVSEAQVIQASKLATLGEMAAGMAHELNQPLNVIRLAAGNILRKAEKGILEPELMRQKLERISDQTERAAKIIDHMAIFGREVVGPL